MKMDNAIEAVLQEYETRAHDEAQRIRELNLQDFIRQRDEFLLAVGPATGQMLNILAKAVKARTILEIGTSYGYSTIWLAEAARATSGKVITLDVHSGKQNHARKQVARAGLADFVDFRLGDARESIGSLDMPIDFVLLDLWKDLYIPCFDLFYPKLSPGALVAADNMIFPESSQADALKYRQHVHAHTGIESILLPVGSGIELTRRSDTPFPGRSQ